MRIEMVFRIYRRLIKKSRDFCDRVVITADTSPDKYEEPTAVFVKFIPPKKRTFTSKEETNLRQFCKYHKLQYRFNKKGEMIWCQELTSESGNEKTGKM